jgi:hypothetical protein
MAFGAARLNGLGKASVVVVAEVIRRKLGIAANGNAQVSTAQAQFGNSSYLGDGTGDFLIVNPLISLTHTGTWTIECWLRATSTSVSITAMANYLASGAFNGWGLRIAQNNSKIEFWDGVAWRAFNNAVSTNTWYHVAIVSTAGSVKMYQGGVEQTTTFTLTTAFNNTTTRTYIGSVTDGTFAWNGNLDEVRISSSARYTTGFTPSTTPFVNDANTVLLLHMSGTNGSTYFEDDNGIRAQRDARALNQAQISTAQSRIGGSSAVFDTTNDNIVVNPNPISGTGNLTVEFWFRRVSAGVQRIIFDFRNGSFLNNAAIYWTSDNKLNLFAAQANRITSAGTYGTGTWFHVAWVRNNGVSRLYVDGTQIGSDYTDTNNYSGTPGLTIGSAYDNSGAIDSYLDEIRISSTARYTGNFTAPTTPFTNDANTLLLLHCDGTNGTNVFRDDNGEGRTSLGVIAVGNAQVDTAQSQFGGSSLLLDGTGDYLSLPSSLSLGTDSFTIECWVRVASLQAAVILDNRSSDQPGVFTIQANGTLLYFDPTVGAVSTSGTYTANTWFHACFERSGNTFRMYINGTASYTNTNFTSNLGTSRNVRIGISYADTSGVNGWIDELRVSNSARYNGNFTAPTAPFQNDANTLLLLHMDGTDASTVFVDDNGKRPT